MIVGHQKQWEFLKKAAELGKLSHAYLFYGEQQLGKKALAIEFIKFLNCQAEQKPCQNCKNCRDIERRVYPDFILVEPNRSNKEIQIFQIKELIEKYKAKNGFKT